MIETRTLYCDEALHRRAAELVADGTLELAGDDKHLPGYAITEDDVRAAELGDG